MAMTKIKLYMSTTQIGENLRSREPDLDHATTIHEMGPGRGKTITARPSDGGPWTLSIYFTEGAFVNSPEGTIRTVQFRPHFGMDDGRLYDDQPEWITKLISLVKKTAPEGVAA